MYDAENRLTTRTLPNGVVTTYTYDLRDRPLSVVHTNASGTVLASRAYVRAPGGEPTRIAKEDGSYVLVGYDSALRIVSERYFDALNALEEEISYAYDADGNRTSKTVNGVVSAYTYASGGRILGAGSNSYGNDNAGRVTSMTRPDATFALTYDSDDHVRSVVKDGVSTNYGFDAIGRRTSVSTGGSTRRYLVAPSMGAGLESPQVVTDGAGAEVASFVFAGEHPIMRIENGEPVYYLQDTMGSVIGTADDAGSVVNTLDYDGFGRARGAEAESVSTLGEFGFQGMWRDPSGLYYVRARTYEPETGRFTSRDPARGSVWSPATMYPYVFADSSPSRRRDPTGAFSIAEQSAVLASINALVNISLSAPVELKRYAQGQITGVVLATRLTSEFSRGVIEGYAAGLGGGFWQVVFRDMVVGAAGELVRQLSYHETVTMTHFDAGNMAWAAIFNAGAGAVFGIVSARLASLSAEIQWPVMQLQLELRRVFDPETALQLALEQGAVLHATRDILSAAEEAASEALEDAMRERSGKWLD